MGNNAAAVHANGSPKDGKTIALSKAHEKKSPSPSYLLIDAIIHNGASFETKIYYNPHGFDATCKNSLFWAAYKWNAGAWEKMQYCGAIPDDKPLSDKELEGMAKPLKWKGTVAGEGIKLHECFKFEAGQKYKIVAEFPPLPNRGDADETVEVQL